MCFLRLRPLNRSCVALSVPPYLLNAGKGLGAGPIGFQPHYFGEIL